MPDQEVFKLPQLHAMDRVLVSQHPGAPDQIPGFVAKAKQRGADIIAFLQGRPMFYHDSVYCDDPRTQTHPQLFEDGDRGVFVLAQSELQQRATILELAAQRELIDQLAAQIAAAPKPKATERKTGS